MNKEATDNPKKIFKIDFKKPQEVRLRRPQTSVPGAKTRNSTISNIYSVTYCKNNKALIVPQKNENLRTTSPMPDTILL